MIKVSVFSVLSIHDSIHKIITRDKQRFQWWHSFLTSQWLRRELANVMGFSEGVQKGLVMCKMQHALQKWVSPMLTIFIPFILLGAIEDKTGS